MKAPPAEKIVRCFFFCFIKKLPHREDRKVFCFLFLSGLRYIPTQNYPGVITRHAKC